MNRISDRDFLFIGVLLFILGVLVIANDKGGGKQVPVDFEHQSVYDGIKSGRSIIDTQLICATCHGKSSSPLPHGHPKKEQCLICHQLA
jgi:hypothetical protein